MRSIIFYFILSISFYIVQQKRILKEIKIIGFEKLSFLQAKVVILNINEVFNIFIKQKMK